MDKIIVFKKSPSIDNSIGFILPASDPDVRLRKFKHYIDDAGKIYNLADFIDVTQEGLEIPDVLQVTVEVTQDEKTEEKVITLSGVYDVETDEEFLARVAEKDVPCETIGYNEKGFPIYNDVKCEWRYGDKSELPDDRYFRNAWTDCDKKKKVGIDIDAAKDVHLEKIREARAQKFIDLGFPNRLDPDLEAAVIPETTRAKLQELRDIPQEISADLAAAKTPEKIKEVWPESLS